jgi:hypothetical protein
MSTPAPSNPPRQALDPISAISGKPKVDLTSCIPGRPKVDLTSTSPVAEQLLTSTPFDWATGTNNPPAEQVAVKQPEPRTSVPVLLSGLGHCPIVYGTEKEQLTRAQYDVVKALLDAGERGLSKDELDSKSRHGDARKILQRLANSDPDWKAVIHFPGKPGIGYRIG